MTRSDQIRARVNDYMNALTTADPAVIAALYSEDATLEDPVGSEIKVGRAAIEDFYSAMSAAEVETELLDVRVAGVWW